MATVLSPSYRNRMEKEINWEEIAAGLNIPGARWEINSEISSCSFANRDPARSRVFAKCLVCDLKLSDTVSRGERVSGVSFFKVGRHKLWCGAAAEV